MKKFLLVALIVSSFSVSATTIKLYQTMFTNASITETFEVNKDLGRAWVNLSVDESPMDPDSMADEVRVKIEGLAYNAETKEVVFAKDNKSIVCAYEKTTGWGIFKYTRLEMTEDCSFKQRFVKKNVDDGFNIIKREYLIVELEIKE